MYCCYRTERRRHKRLRVSLSATYKVKGPSHVYAILGVREFEAEAFDISAGGIALKASHYLPEHTILTINLVIFELSNLGSASFHNPITLTGEVRSVDSIKNDEYRLGIEFQEISPGSKQKLEDIIYSPLKAPSFSMY